MIDFNTEPYNDDFDEDNKFYRILFRPSFAVQARELTQLQTILQNQIKRHGDAIFKQGAMVIPGQASVETSTNANKGADYVKLQPIYNGIAVETFVNSLQDQIVVGSSGITAQVYHIENLESTEPTTIYVRYLDSGTSNTVKTFADNEVISTVDNTYSFQALATGATGKGSLATISRGVYYVNGHFCLVEDQTISLDKYDSSPSYRVGLLATEFVVTPEEDETLLDNAQNSYNFAAPGAHRYSIHLALTKKDINTLEDQDFVELIRVVDGRIKTIVDQTQYSELAKELARRTYDESGDYTVREFPIDVREYRDNNRGVWVKSTVYLAGDVVTNPSGVTYTAKNSGTSSSIDNSYPTHTFGTVIDGTNGIYWEYTPTPVYNRGINKPPAQTSINAETIATQRANEAKLAIGLEAGKAYVQGYEIEKDSTTYVTVNKARDYLQSTGAVVPATVGNYILVTNVNNAPPIDTLDRVTIYNRVSGSSGRGSVPSGAQIVGYARVRFMEWHDIQPFGYSSIYKLGLFDIQINPGYDFGRDAKCIYATATSGSSDANLAFTADIQPITLSTNNLTGFVTAAGTTVTGSGTSFTADFRAGDYINVSGSVYRIASIASATSLTLDTSLTATNSRYTRAETQLQEPTNSSLIFQLPYSSIRSVRKNGDPNINYWPELASSGSVDVLYQVYQKFTQTASGTTLTLSTSGTFASAAETDNYICINNDATDGGAIFTPASITVSGSTCTINVGASYSGRSITVIASVIKSGAEKTKTLTQYTGIQSGNTFTTATAAQQPVILLEHADVFKIKSIKMAPAVAFGSTPTYAQYTVDISDRYEFDNGQRLTHYDLARLTLKQSYALPSNPIIVEYEYFEHGAGDYFSVNSYTNAATGSTAVDYKDIPSFVRDSLDFRPKVANKSGGTVRNFLGTGASITGVPKRGIDVTASFTYYLKRKDKISLDVNGKFSAITGVPSLTPGEPQAPSLGMILYNLTYEPYTFDTTKDSVSVQKIENKRYTMRDIGKLEKRIDNLEYYTSLSLLETETQSLKIPDSTGLDRLKNGFIVDNFKSSTIADTKSQDYKCSIDMAKGELRPFYTMYNSNLLEKNTLTAQRTSAGYKLNGDIITLPILSNEVLIKQDYASRLENINPFAIFTFLGNVTINPPSDEWFETERLPDLINNVEGNYNAVRDAAIASGQIGTNGLGTVWSAWQNEWAGVPVSQNVTFVSTSGTKTVTSSASGQSLQVDIGGEGGGGRRVVEVQVTAQQIGQSRFGIETNLVQKVDYETVGDRVVSTAVIPYIRSRNILVQSKGLKPNTRFWAYFDSVDISSYITPCAKLVYTVNSGTFDDSTNVGGNSNETKRRINGDSQVCLNRGDVITNNNGTAWAVVVHSAKEPQFDANKNITGYKYVLDLANVNGSFTTLINGQAQTITGSVSGAIGTVVSFTQPTTLVTNPNGALNFIFNIPNTDAVHFRTGSKELKLIDVSTVNGQFTSRGRAVYHAEGVLETKQTTINAVRNAELVREMITDSQTVWQTNARVVSDTGWYDPLAQSFLVENKGGAFITKIDIFFATKDDSVPVTLEIRELINGTPGKNVLPFSRVTLTPDKVNLSTNTVTLPDGSDVPSYDTPTSFVFETPVYLQDMGEYAFVLVSDSNNYKVWISNMGDEIPGQSGRTISAQPYNGVLFKSQNASTWTPEQNQDIKFTIYRAKFDTSVTGTVDFVNDVTPYQLLETDPFQTVSGTNTVRVWHRDHGMTDGSKVNIKGVAAAVNGIPLAEFNTDKTIGNVDMDSYTITTTTNATSTGYAGGSAVYATKNIQYDVLMPTVEMQNFSDTTTSFYVRTTSGRSVDGGQTAYSIDSYATPCLNKQNNYFTSPRMIASEINENTFMAGADSATFTVYMRSTNDSLSPVIDTARASLICINNKVNYPLETNINVSALDTKTIFTGATGAFSFANIGTAWSSGATAAAGTQYYTTTGNLYTVTQSGTLGGSAPIHTYGRAQNGTAVLEYAGNSGSIQSTNSTVRGLLPNLAVGKYITVSSTTNNNGTFLVTGYRDDGTTGTIILNTLVTSENSVSGSTVQLRELFVDEIAPVGSSTYSKYVTSPVKLNLSSTYTRIKLAANVPSGSDIAIYYKTCVGDSSQLRTTKYTLANPSGNGITKVELGDETFYDVDYDLENMIPFDNIVVKIVMKSTNSCAVPRIKDLRIIACA